jgi:oxygen-independent coproporphyrinogen-3 oxidase
VRYVSSLLKELSHYASNDDWNGRVISTIFFGGGTPSLLSSKSVAAILKTAREHFTLDAEAEVTLEANPGSVSEKLAVDRLSDFRDAGVNRISFGVQSFNPKKLKFLGRLHTAEDTYCAVDNVRRAGITNFNLDLIFGCSGDCSESWLTDVNSAVELNPSHLSCYSLTIEPGTVFGKLSQQGNLPTLDDETSSELFTLTDETLKRHDYHRYEISNFAKPSYECRHNINYWLGNDYLGLGAGAHSYCGPNKRWINLPGPIHYIEAIGKNGDAATRRETITSEQRGIELLLLSLRTRDGLDLSGYEEQTGLSFLQNRTQVIHQLEAERLIQRYSITDRPYLRLTERGFLMADEILKMLA